MEGHGICCLEGTWIRWGNSCERARVLISSHAKSSWLVVMGLFGWAWVDLNISASNLGSPPGKKRSLKLTLFALGAAVGMLHSYYVVYQLCERKFP